MLEAVAGWLEEKSNNLLTTRIDRRQLNGTLVKSGLVVAMIPTLGLEAKRTPGQIESDSGIGFGRPFDSFSLPDLVKDTQETFDLQTPPLMFLHRSGNSIKGLDLAVNANLSLDADGNYSDGIWDCYHGSAKVFNIRGHTVTVKFDTNTLSLGIGEPETLDHILSTYRRRTHGINMKPVSYELKRCDGPLDAPKVNKVYDSFIQHGADSFIHSSHPDRVNIAKKVGKERFKSDFDPGNYAYFLNEAAWKRFFDNPDYEGVELVISHASYALQNADRLLKNGIRVIVDDAIRVATVRDLQQKGIFAGIMSDLENLTRFERCIKLHVPTASRRELWTPGKSTQT